MDLKMGCLQAERGSPSFSFLQVGGAYRRRVLKENSLRPFCGDRAVGRGLAEKWQQGRRTAIRSMGGDSPFPSDDNRQKQREVDELGTSSFCIIEGPETLQSFATMQLQEIQDNVRSRRNKIFLLMEEVRRLRVQQRIKMADVSSACEEHENEMPDIPSSIPFLPHLTPTTLRQFYVTCFSFMAGIILFGGLLAPSLEIKLGLGGTSYEDFIRNMHLPLQLSQVDPIVASFSGGAVGVISALMLVEVNNVDQQKHKTCRYCHGTGYLTCGRCSATGSIVVVEPIARSSNSDSPLQLPTTGRCPNCSGVGKVMCPTCLCTGMVMVSEHDPRIDPFD